MKFIHSLSIILILSLVITSCKKKPTPDPDPTPTPTPTNTLFKLGETYIQGAGTKAILYSDDTLKTGLNVIYAALFDSVSGAAISSGHFDINPMMDMGMMKHSAPVENSEDTLAQKGYFKSAVIFSMPGTAAQWSLNIDFHNHQNGHSGSGKLGVNVVASNPARFISTVLTGDSNATVFITLIKPSKPVGGLNDFELVLHKKKSMMEYPPIEDYTFVIEPEMPSMGHGSPNNINPVHTSDGHYLGKVNFTMNGLWKVNLKIYKNGVLLSDTKSFEITL